MPMREWLSQRKTEGSMGAFQTQAGHERSARMAGTDGRLMVPIHEVPAHV